MNDNADREETPTIPTVADVAVKLRSFGEMPADETPPPKDQAELAQVLAAHRAWVESIADVRAKITGRRARLGGLDLRGVNLSRRDLRGADFTGANLEGAILQHCLLTFANFTGANLRHADLRGAKLHGAALEDACLEGALFDATSQR